MRLQLYHPEVAALDCSDCKKWIYGKDWKRSQRGGQDVPRPPGTPTPCRVCPKQSPENAERLKLTRWNQLTLARYNESLATGGQCLRKSERRDRWQARLFAVIATELKEFDRTEQLRNLVEILRVVKGL